MHKSPIWKRKYERQQGLGSADSEREQTPINTENHNRKGGGVHIE